MTTSVKKDNSTFDRKLWLRRAVLGAAKPHPLVLETHGGVGRLFERCWYRAEGGLVLERDEAKAEALALQRPTWRVYCGDSLKLLAAGIGADLAFDVVDVDPYGQAVDVLDALAASARPWPDVWHLVVNDGGRQPLRVGIGWNIPRMRRYVQRFGNRLYPVYLELVRVIVEEFAASIGFRVAAWHCYATGQMGDMTHYWARLERLDDGKAPAAASGGPVAADRRRGKGKVAVQPKNGL